MFAHKGMLAITITLVGFIFTPAWGDDTQYTQKNYPNGDVESTYSAPDGSSVVSIRHKDGSYETTKTNTSGGKSISIEHVDGSIDTHVTTTNQ